MELNLTIQPGESPKPPFWDYDEWATDDTGEIYHQLYGHWWKRSDNDSLVHIELECFRESWGPDDGGLGRYGHLVNAVNLLWNSGDKKTVEWNPWLEQMLEKACDNDYLGVAGASSTSKSFGGAILAWVHVLCSPSNSLALVTSTSIQAAKKRIWRSVIQLHNGLPEKYRKMFKHKPSANMFHFQRTDGKIADDSCSISLIASEQKQEANAVAKLVGLKNDRVLLVADELCELSHSIVAACDNLMSNPEYRMVAMSNPKDREDPFGVLMEPIDGWNAIDESTFEWKTKLGIGIRFDVLQSPNYLERENIYKYMLTYEKVERARQLHGDTSARFYRFFRGFWPIVGVEDCLYSETDFRAYLKDSVEWKGQPIKVASLDLSQSSGGDANMLTIGLFGEDKEGVKCLSCEKQIHLKEDAAHKNLSFPEQIMRQVKKILEQEGIDPKNFGVDNTAAKWAVEWLVKELGRDVIRIEFGGKASDRPVTASDRTPACKRYERRVAELWGVGIEFLRGGQWVGLRKHPELITELKARHYDMIKSGDGERLRVEPKKEMKLRAGKSPDRADSWMILTEVCRQRFHWTSAERGINILPEDAYEKTLRDLDVVTQGNKGMFDWYPSSAA